MWRFQDPYDPLAPTLLEELIAASVSAEAGGAVFAYARANGIDLLLRDPEFQRFLKTGRFDLIVGVDGVTDVSALDRLQTIAAEFPRLRTKVFFHDRPATTFHPKFSWFRGLKGGIALVGSGNLTVGGLTTNWEAFAIVPLTPAGARAAEAEWQRWKALHAFQLRDVSDSAVRARAAKNIATRPDRNVHDDIPRPGRPNSASEALIVEVPRASTRWNQANLDQSSFVNFFHANDPRRRVQLWHVNDSGKIAADPEIRPGVAVKSKNFRIELRAAAGLPYPSPDRPIAVFVATGFRRFLYMLLMPSSPHYRQVAEILAKGSRSPKRQMKRLALSADQLSSAWPGSPLWSYSGT
jgi:hypothetical protein